MTDDSLTKICRRCNIEKPVSMFYKRSGTKGETTGQFISECISCMKERAKTQKRFPRHSPRVETEAVAIERLRENGVYAVPGKAVYAADVDIVAWGAVWIEVKYSKLRTRYKEPCFYFSTTKRQRQRGLLAHIILLICDYGDNKTFHLFSAKDPVFYECGNAKTMLEYTPGKMDSVKHRRNRVVMTQPMMESAEDNYGLVYQEMERIKESLRNNGFSDDQQV